MPLTTNINHLTRDIIAAAIEVHRHLGPGLLEKSYGACLRDELTAVRLAFQAERLVPVTYKGRSLDTAYRIDLIVEDLVVVELKAVDHVIGVHEAQVLTYLRVTDCPLGLLINFNVPKLVDGVRRLVNPRRTIYLGDDINF